MTWKSILISLAAVGIALGLYLVAGGINVSADRPDGWITRHALHFIFKRSIGSRSASVLPPADLTAQGRVKLGAQQYSLVCANCHGEPGFGQSVVALSMSPRPQNLPKVIGQFTDPELYLIVMHGVKFSAMPSWPNDTRNDEVWSMVAFLRQLPTMSASAYREMTSVSATSAGTPPMNLRNEVTLRPADIQRNAPPADEFLYAAPASGFGAPMLRADPAATCAGCHDADGTGRATGGEAPNLTIQDADYLRASLGAYSKGERKSGFMQLMSSQLSNDQINALADYYAHMPAQALAAAGSTPSPELVKRGETIALEGIKEKAIAACANCHESAGSKLSGAPHIAGQSEPFLRHQLEAMRLGGRGSTGLWNPMPAETHALADNEIAGLAAYYSSLTPGKAGRTAEPAAPAQPPKGDLAAADVLFRSRCVTCHMNEGRGDPKGEVPNLTIHTAAYVAQALHDYRVGTKQNNKMLETAGALTFSEMASLANYVNALPAQKALSPVNPAAAEKGRSIAENGVAARGVPACLSCHDAKGTAALPLIPHLQGQSANYLQTHLDAFADVTARFSSLNPMPQMARELSAEERAEVAAYFALASPLEKPTSP